jgi:ribosomal protein S18 acetylase RimI-like enzyme
MTLRAATMNDAQALADLGRRAFVAKFGHLYSAANLAAFLDEAHAPTAVARELADPDMAIAVIEEKGAIVAFCKIRNRSALPRHHSAARPFELKQLYTDPDLVGRGLGARLMDWALERAHSVEADTLELTVYADNPAAQRFYARYGLEKIADITFQVGNHIDPEILMAVRL